MQTLVARVRTVGARHQRWLLGVAVVAFAVTAVLAFRGLPGGLEVRWWPIAVSALLVSPLSTAANAAEFAATARILGQDVAAREALRVAVLSSAANLLPLPGAVAVRTVRLRADAGVRRAFAVTAGAGLCWLGTSLLCAGAADLVVNQRLAGVAFVAGGAAVVAVAAATVLRAADAGTRSAWWFLWATELAQVAVAAARLMLAVAALGSSVTVAQGLGLAVAPVAASAIGVLPGGLGLREAIAASLAALVALPAAVGGAAAAVDRIVGLGVLSLLTVPARHASPVPVQTPGGKGRFEG